MKKLIVTRHKALALYLFEKGLVEEDTKCMAFARVEDVKGYHVFGVLPYWLAAEAELYTEIQMRLPPALRERELTIEEVRFHATRHSTYRVKKINWK